VFGYQDIKFESAEFFQGVQRALAGQEIRLRRLQRKDDEYLLANRDLSIEIENEVIALAFNTRLSVEQIESNLQRLVELRSRLPDYLFTNA